MPTRTLLGILLLLSGAGAAEYHPPAGQRYAIAGRSESILPGGRVIEPLGLQIETGPGPFGLAVSERGAAATANIGYERFGITVVEPEKGGWRRRDIWARTPGSHAPEQADPDWKGVFYGIAFADEHSIWICEGDSGRVRLVDAGSGETRKLLNLNGGEWKHSFATDLAWDRARKLLFVVDQANFRIAIVDGRRGRVLGSATVGRMPFSIALSQDGLKAWVANAGVFRYEPLPGALSTDPLHTGLPFPAFGFPSPESLAGAMRRTQAGTINVPALGDPNVQESNSVCVIDVKDAANPRVVDWIRTGRPFGPNVAGGSAPAGVVTTDDRVFVSNAHDDSITVIDAHTDKILRELPLGLPGLENLRGILPAGMAWDPVTKRLLVAEAGINAVAIVNPEKPLIAGLIPVGWLPTRVAISGDRVFVTNARGRGTGPNMRRPLMELGEVPYLHHGTLSTFIMPADAELPKLTQTALVAGGLAPVQGPAARWPPGIHYVVLIVKENRTFDEVLGDVTEAANGKVRSFADLARFAGEDGRADGHNARFSIQHAAITPNHHAIAKQWAFSDNFYADSDVSVDGHHWLTGAYPDLLTESGLLAAYGGQRQFVLSGDSPGRLQFAGSDSSTHPEEEPEAGTLWHHLARHHVSFRNFGEGFELAGVVEDKDEEPTGARFLTNVPMPEPLFKNTSRDYPGFNMNIPDQYRASQFIAEIERRYVKNSEPFPHFIYIHLPDDHMAPPRPQDGYPYGASFVEDNDLALGRIVEYLSHSKWWPGMQIFVTEDDAQGGLDHIDAHRTILLAAGPYTKKNYCSHVNTSFPGLLKTIFGLLGMPPLNLMDATAADLRDLFTDLPDGAPYTTRIPDKRVFDAAAARAGQGKSIPMDQPF
jgi:DNA-binding beta-propeller fold protein YncE